MKFSKTDYGLVTAEAPSGFLLPVPTEEKEDYSYPPKDQAGYYETENTIQPGDLGCILHTADGKFWEVRKYFVDRMSEYGVEPHEVVTHGKMELPVWRVDKGGEDYYTTGFVKQGGHKSIAINDCVYRAIDTYLISTGLGKLSKGDMSWFDDHPNVSSDGVGRAHVLGIAHGLVAPYGLGIDRVYFPRLSVLGDEHKEFAKALGMNPDAQMTNAISNAEFLEGIGQPDGEIADHVNNECRLEFVEEPPRPCVVMVNKSLNVYKTNKKKPQAFGKQHSNVAGSWSSTPVGSGHADYVGPRDKISGQWILAFTISRNPEYRDQECLSGYAEICPSKKEKKPESSLEKTLSAWGSSIGGETLTDRHKVSVQPIAKPSKVAVKNNGNKGIGTVVGVCEFCGSPTKKIDNYTFCVSCTWWESDDGTDWLSWADDPPICPFCWSELVEDACPTCSYHLMEWGESALYLCEKHKDTAFHKGARYVCPDCLREAGVTLDDYINNPKLVDIKVVMDDHASFYKQ